MYNYNRIYKLGYLEGTKASIEDTKKNKKRKFKKINRIDILSKLYDLGFIEGYNTCYRYMKINSFK